MRFTSLLAATGLLASGLAFAAPAHAVPTNTQAVADCKPLVPARLVIRAPRTYYSIGLSSSCPTTLYDADWEGHAKAGDPVWETLEYAKGARAAGLILYDDVSPIGLVNWAGDKEGGTNSDGVKVANLLPVASNTKYASSARIAGKRVGRTTTLVTTVGYYNPKANKSVLWSGKLVTLQYKAPGTSTWNYLGRATTNRAGQASFTWTPGVTRHYRAYVPGNRSIWDFTTAAISK